MELVLREARPADRASCVQIFTDAAPLAYPRMVETAPSPIDFEAATREEDVWVAETQESICGWVAVYSPARFVHHLYVDPRHLRQGIGKALLDLAVRRCGGSAELKCDEANRAGQSFYQEAGWRPVEWGWSPSGPWIRFRR